MLLLYGTGRAATHLGHAFVKAGVQVVGVVGRNEEARMRWQKLLPPKLLERAMNYRRRM
ncbi:MAG: hypothetical protein IPI00_17745 [Flavobacteriales bacterium]|nr:hypothetical protein [Flavobacteriales bacterium]